MDIEMNGLMTRVDMVGEDPVMSFYFSDAGPLEPEMCTFIDEVLSNDGSKEVTLNITVPLCEVVDGLIDCHRTMMHKEYVVMDPGNQPLVAAARDALQKAIAKLDAIKWEVWVPHDR